MIDNSTIAAISTAHGVGAIAVVRLSGDNAIQIADRVFISTSGKKLSQQAPNTLHLGFIYDDDVPVDEVFVAVFKSPNSYTGEDLIEISCHGSLYIQQKILELLVSKGARVARPGEFTLRAFLNGKMDLSQAEAVADLVASTSRSFHKVAMNQMRGGFTDEIKKLRERLLKFVSLIELELDFSEEDVEFADRDQLKQLVEEIETLLRTLVESFTLGNVIKNGIPVAIAGKTNSGKSTLLNLLLKEDKAIVSEIEGTTRDFIEDTISIEGIHFRFIDTAGLRHTTDKVEKLGIERTYKKIRQASIVMLMIDPATDTDEIIRSVKDIEKQVKGTDKKLVVIINKTDLLNNQDLDSLKKNILKIVDKEDKVIPLSAKKGDNLPELEKALLEIIHAENIEQNDVIVTNARHYEALKHSHEAILRVRDGLESQISGDLLAQDIRETLHYLGEITGEITTDEILGNIFKNFCIGK
ncbi:MAG: tRNA uridine-5-carboxymethylaminomethyl(34) synthesis GTPase MnmE [Bacteroidales bacterium]|nr:tRNA uridine-5-carboxymethylaminomethyl(34) synthesis GTPase MnmE [Bacteroidales bacterium]